MSTDVKRIEHFMLPENTNNLYKNEAVSSIYLTKEVADKINELVDACNGVADGNLEKHHELEGMIRKGVLFMKDNLVNSLHDLFDLLYKSGDLDGIITDVVAEGLRAVKERTDHLVSVKEFGAAGDGIQDDTRAFQEALDYAAKHGKSILVPNGKFLITEPLQVTDTVNMYGDGQSSQNTSKSTIIFSVRDMELPLFTGSGQLGRCHFENITFARSRTEGDGYDKNNSPFAYGKSGICIGFNSNETSFHRCTFIGFGAVLVRAGITDFIDCDIVYCGSILKNNTLCNSVNFYGGNIYACGTLLKAEANLSNVNFTNCWIEDFETVLETKGVTIMSLNFTGCTLTNTANGKEILKYTGSPSFAREFINFNECLLYFKTNICSTFPKNIEFAMNFENSVVHYGGEGETIKITGNSRFLNLDGSNTDKIKTNYGFNTKTCTAHSPITFDKVSLTSENQIGKPNNFIETKDKNGNRMLMLPVYYEFVTNPHQPRYFVFNTQAVSTGDWVLKFVYSAGGSHIEKVIVTL